MKALGTTLVALLVLALPAVAGATTITVDTRADTLAANACSLREAISAVNAPGTHVGDCPVASAGADTILLGAGDYGLSLVGADETGNMTGDLNVFGTVSGLTVVGTGPAATIIDAGALGDRVLNIAAGATVTLRDLRVTGGIAPAGRAGAPGANSSTGDGHDGGMGSPGENGGGILNAGTLTLDHVTVTSNHAGQGGAGGNGGASTGASGAGGTGGYGGGGGSGGGIYNGGSLTVTDSAISYNNPYTGGLGGSGGVGGISANGAGGDGGYGTYGGYGGGIYNAGALTISGSTIDHNDAGDAGAGASGGNGLPGGSGLAGADGGEGGGISSLAGTFVSITNTTIADNRAGDGGAGGSGGNTDNDLQNGANGANGGDGGDGGGLQINNPSDRASLLNVTVAGNQAGSAGDGGVGGNVGGLQGYNGSPGAAGAGGGIADYGRGSILQNTLVASNQGGNCYGSAIFDGGHDLGFGDISCPGSTTVDPDLGALEDNGGPTETIALGAGSAALDAVPASGADCPPTDQRGALRPAGAACDVGAYELATPTATTGSSSAGSSGSDTVTGSAFNPDVAPGTAYFQYGPTTAYGASSAEESVAALITEPISAVLAGLAPGATYHYRLVVTNGAGTEFGVDRTFTASATAAAGAAASGTTAYGTPAPAGGTAHPTIEWLKISPDRFSRRHGATVTYDLGEAATTTFTVLRPVAGRLRGHTCVEPGRASRTGRRCVRWVAFGRAFTHTSAAGTVRFKLSVALSPGDYLQATPRADGLAGNAITTAFVVAAARRGSREPAARGGAR